MPSRQSDPNDLLHMQTERVFCSDKEWFFCTREGIGVGPYASEEMARYRGKELAKRLSTLHDKEEIIACIRHFVFETSGLVEVSLLKRQSF